MRESVSEWEWTSSNRDSNNLWQQTSVEHLSATHRSLLGLLCNTIGGQWPASLPILASSSVLSFFYICMSKCGLNNTDGLKSTNTHYHLSLSFSGCCCCPYQRSCSIDKIKYLLNYLLALSAADLAEKQRRQQRAKAEMERNWEQQWPSTLMALRKAILAIWK